MLSPKTKRNIYRIIPFSVIWLVFSIVYAMLEKGILGNLPYYPSTGNPYNYARNIFVTPLSALITGTFLGALEIFYFNKSLIYLAIILVFLVTSVIASSGAQDFVFGKQGWQNVWVFFTSYSFLS